ncbi:hypothetical protein, partial [Dyadobacter sp. LHD-138]|uniref:hypothetical protein n=1 Tax=Dyadobacter sp. LHD-138 TaxID=3071413 RepID=UPI0027E18405
MRNLLPWKYLVSLTLSLSLVVVFYACRNTQEDPSPQLESDTSFDLGIVKNGYEQLVQNPTNLKTGNGKKEKTKKKKINWNGSYTFNVDGQDKMIIPYELEEDIYYKNPDSSMASYSANTFFVVSKKGKDYEYELVTRFPDVKWLNRTKRAPFSGKVIVEDVNGEFKKGFILDEGRQVQEFIPSSQSGRTST